MYKYPESHEKAITKALSQLSVWKPNNRKKRSFGSPSAASSSFPWRLTPAWSQGWSPLHNDWIKINFDGVVNSFGNFIGYIIRNSSGNIITSHQNSINVSSPLQEEALAALAGVTAAIALGFQKVVIEGDNATVMHSIRKTWKAPWDIANIVKDIDELLNTFPAYKTSLIKREANVAADFITKSSWTDEDVDFISDILNNRFGKFRVPDLQLTQGKVLDFVKIICSDDLGIPI